MAYVLKEVTIRTDNSEEGMAKIADLWEAVSSGKLPILFDSEGNFQPGISPISVYSNYENQEKGLYDLSIMGVKADFFGQMEQAVAKGLYKKYDESNAEGNIGACAAAAWGKVWAEQAQGIIKRGFTVDYESSVPAEYTKDGKAHCYLYIALENGGGCGGCSGCGD